MVDRVVLAKSLQKNARVRLQKRIQRKTHIAPTDTIFTMTTLTTLTKAVKPKS